MPSGTQSNLAALLSHCGRGDEYIAGMDAHCYAHEQGGAAWLGSIQPQPIPHQPDGTLALEAISTRRSSPTTCTMRGRGCWRSRTRSAGG